MRYVINGEINVKYVTTQSVDRPYSSSIYSAMKIAFESIGLDSKTLINKVVGLGCDGASVNLGHKNGFIALMKRDQPRVKSIYCFAHQ